MGGSFSATEYIKTIRAFNEKNEFTREDDANVELFLQQSCDFFNVFTSSTLEDYRELKKQNVNNLIFLISSVSHQSIW
jgi:hypothetical protein